MKTYDQAIAAIETDYPAVKAWLPVTAPGWSNPLRYIYFNGTNVIDSLTEETYVPSDTDKEATTWSDGPDKP